MALPIGSFVSPGVPAFAPAAGGGDITFSQLTVSTLTLNPIGLPGAPDATNLFGSIQQTNAYGYLFIGDDGLDGTYGNRMSYRGQFSNSTEGSIAFGDINGSNSALTLINYEEAAFPGAISTIVFGSFEVKNGNATIPSLNGGTPALTSLFSTLFAANPSLSTIVY